MKIAYQKRSVPQSLLTVAIPTFNRAPKLKRLLDVLREEIVGSHLQTQVHVLVSDNASFDRTPVVASEFMNGDFHFTYHRQSRNLGFDGNLRFLYVHTDTQFIWFMADDDLPLPGAVGKVVAALETYDPDVLLFSFIQPPRSAVRTFNFPDPVHLISDPVSAVDLILKYPKVSIFVLRRVEFGTSYWKMLTENLGVGWYHISLAFSVLDESQNLRMAIISEQLATCDEDYNKLSFVTSVFLKSYRAMQHPLVLRHSPGLVKEYYVGGYYQAILFLYRVKSGVYSAEDPEAYDEDIRTIECRVWALVKRPRYLLQFMVLKLGIANWWPKIKRWLKPLAYS